MRVVKPIRLDVRVVTVVVSVGVLVVSATFTDVLAFIVIPSGPRQPSDMNISRGSYRDSDSSGNHQHQQEEE